MTIRARAFTALVLLALAWPALAQNQTTSDPFLQGPESRGHTRNLAGKVIGIHHDPGRKCYIMLADRPGGGWEGLGGGGRFFLCQSKGQPLNMGQHWSGKGTQEGTRLHRMGPRRRVLPLFVPSS